MILDQTTLNHVAYAVFGVIGSFAAAMVVCLPVAVSRAVVHHDYKLVRKAVVGLFAAAVLAYITLFFWGSIGFSMANGG
jgi:hypothetical protein